MRKTKTTKRKTLPTDPETASVCARAGDRDAFADDVGQRPRAIEGERPHEGAEQTTAEGQRASAAPSFLGELLERVGHCVGRAVAL